MAVRRTGDSGTHAPDPRASEEMRHLTQARLALLGLVTLCLGGGFLLIAIVAEAALYGPARALAHLVSVNGILNAVGASVSAIVWLVARRGTRTPGQLLTIDGVGTVSAVVPYTLMSVLGQEGMDGVLLTALTVMLVLQTRALMVPSDARRTLYVSLVSVLLTLVLSLGAHVAEPERRGGAGLESLGLNLVLWLAVIVTVSTTASWVLFGLRQQIHEARRLGQYILMEKIGQGGMGLVYRARHQLLRRPTAVKLLPPELTGPSAIRRFEREVQLTASLQHPNTIRIFDYGRTSDGVFYYVMEYLDGADLETVIEVGGPMPAARVAHVLRQIAAGLAEAHEIGLIHRDVKPANVLLAGNGPIADLVKVVDFGLVREMDRGDASALTRTDVVMGTPLYMAPEAIVDSKAVDARADLYALGAVAYYLLTASPVFEGRTVVEICSQHLHKEPELPSVRLGGPVPETLEEIVMRCLEKDPAERPQSALELGELLDACEDVGNWTIKDARAWWTEHAEAVAARRGPVEVDGTAPTVAVDTAHR